MVVEVRERPLRATGGSTETSLSATGSLTRRQAYRPYRNDIPAPVPYQWRARTYPWVRQAVAAAIAEHGEPRLRRLHSCAYVCDPPRPSDVRDSA